MRRSLQNAQVKLISTVAEAVELVNQKSDPAVRGSALVAAKSMEDSLRAAWYSVKAQEEHRACNIESHCSFGAATKSTKIVKDWRQRAKTFTTNIESNDSVKDEEKGDADVYDDEGSDDDSDESSSDDDDSDEDIGNFPDFQVLS